MWYTKTYTQLISALLDTAFLSENYNRGKSQNLTFKKTENLLL